MEFNNKVEYYNFCRDICDNNNINISDYKEINYGLQFIVTIDNKGHSVRIYESKKNGVKIDFSLIKDVNVLEHIGSLFGNNSKKVNSKNNNDNANKEIYLSDIDSNALIGVDESGKGDYFGPLVIAGVYANESIKKELRKLRVEDSKKLSDKKIAVLAYEIKNICQYEIVVIGNLKYNELYERINNLNKLLAWGHARIIESLIEKTSCQLALSDQFGNPSLIKNALMSKGRNITLEQKHKAEENIVVAAASILARNEFVKRMDILSNKYSINFPKGASNATKNIVKEFVEKYGVDELRNVAKLHFKTTNEILNKN